METMTHMSRRASDAIGARRGDVSLAAENQLLKERVYALEQLLAAERNAVALSRTDRDLLREANAHLVQATFGAEDQKEAAENVSRRQKVFLSMLAHELHNPIAAISTANSFMLAAEMVSPRAEKMVGIVGRQTAHLRRLVDDLLDVARINTGKVSLKPTLLALHEVIDNAVELSMPMLLARRQNVVVDLPSAPVLLMGDMVRLSQLFSNLLINASKFSDAHLPIFVTARASEHLISVAVKDQGIGIALEDQPRIFDLFAQAEDKLGRGAASGLGIGLALVETITQLHGGSVHVTSDGLQCGSEFTVVLPLL